MNDYFVNVAGSKDSTFEDFDDHPKLMGLTQMPLILSSLICLVVVKKGRLDNVFSEWKPITTDVPQGSLLGSLLFNIFINDLNDFISTVSLRLYVDNTTGYI